MTAGITIAEHFEAKRALRENVKRVRYFKNIKKELGLVSVIIINNLSADSRLAKRMILGGQEMSDIMKS